MRAPPGRSAIRPTDAALLVAALVVFVVVVAAPVRAADGVLVLAPHPDDEVIVAGGILYAAQQAGREVTVAVVTNGDFLGLEYGDVRENECVAGLAVLGIPEERIVFLGYPDAGLLPLWNNAPGTSAIYLSPYTGRDATYATRGRGGTDLHTALTGAPGPYNRPTLVADVRALLESARPADVYTTGVFDDHPDHRATFYALRDALNDLGAADASFRPVVHTTVVHDPLHYPFDDFWPPSTPRETPLLPGNDQVWPNPSATSGVVHRFDPVVALARPPSFPPLGSWDTRDEVAVPAAMAVFDFDHNLKVQSLARHATQVSDILWAHVKSTEVFWSQRWRLGAFPHDIAPVAVVSTNSAAGAGAAGAVDGIVDGAPANPRAEWVAAAPGAGATLGLTWQAPVTIDRIVLYDRVSLDDRITAGRLVLDDGTEIGVGALANDGRGDEFVLAAPHRVTSVTFHVDAAYGTPGLAEIEVFGARTVETCQVDADCDDGDACTADVCRDGVCSETAAPDGTPCGDGDDCNGVESCAAGVCVRHGPPACDDGDPCTADSCSASGCVHAPVCHPRPARGSGRCRIALAGVPMTACRDGDAACDEDRTSDGTCRFEAILCVNGGSRAAGCRLRTALTAIDVPADAEDGIRELVGRLGARLPTAAETCVGPTSIQLSLRPGARMARRRIGLRLTTADGHRSRARVSLACRAAPGAGHGPAPAPPK